MSVEVGFDGLEMCHASRDDSGFVSGATEFKNFFDQKFQFFSTDLVSGSH
jgi:hypothetical protein